MFDSSVSSNIPTSPAATSISVVIPSGPGYFFSDMLRNTCSTSLRVIGDSTSAAMYGMPPLLSSLYTNVFRPARYNLILLHDYIPIFVLNVCRSVVTTFSTSHQFDL